MAEKILNTRIQLKYDTLTNWSASTFILKKGEMAIVSLGNMVDGSTRAEEANWENKQYPVLFKVGDGAHKFSELPYASALAADVYAWAKASDVVLEGKTIKFVGTNKEISIPYITSAEAQTLIDNALAAYSTTEQMNAAIEAEANRAKGVEADLDERLEALESGDASVAKQIASAIADLDAEESQDAGADGLALSITEVDGKITAISGSIAANTYDAYGAAAAAQTAAEAAAAAALAEAKTALQKEIDDDVKVETDRATLAEQGLSNRIAAFESGDASVAKQIENAVDALDSTAEQSAGADGLALAIALENGKVTSISGSIAANTYDAYGSAAAVLGSTTDEAGDATVHGALKAAAAAQADIDAFMAAADTGEAALDTLKEIQDFLNSDEGTVQTLIDKVSDNENAIADIVDGTTVVPKAQDAVNATNAQNAVNATNAVNAEKAADSDKLGGTPAADYALKTDAQGYANTAESNAKGYADTEIGNAKTELIGTVNDAATANTIAGAKKYADEAAASANSEALDDAKAYTDEREVEIKKYADQAEADAVTTAKAYTDEREAEITTAYEAYADQAEVDAKAYADGLVAALDSSVAATAEADNQVSVLTGVTQTDGKLTDKTEVKLAAIAKTGNVNDLIQTSGNVLVFNCGSASEVI